MASENIKKVVLAYSGGLDTSVILRWLKDRFDCEVIAYCADVGQAEETAGQVLEMNSRVLDELANALLDAETLSGPSLDVYLEAVQPWPQPLLKNVNGHAPPVAMREAVGGYEHGATSGDVQS